MISRQHMYVIFLCLNKGDKKLCLAYLHQSNTNNPNITYTAETYLYEIRYSTGWWDDGSLLKEVTCNFRFDSDMSVD